MENNAELLSNAGQPGEPPTEVKARQQTPAPSVQELDDLRAAAASLPHRLQAVAISPRQSGLPLFVQSIQKRLDTAVRTLSSQRKNSSATPPSANDAVLLLLENSRLLEAALEDIAGAQKDLVRLPHIQITDGHTLPRILGVAADFVAQAATRFSIQALNEYFFALQRVEPLRLKELYALAPALKLQMAVLILTQAEQTPIAPSAGISNVFDLDVFHLLDQRIGTLRTLNQIEWRGILGPLIAFERLLLEDPSGAYAQMEDDSRDAYRQRIAELACHSDVSETEVARIALGLAREAQQQQFSDPRVHQRRMHIGYFIVDDGYHVLARKVGYRPPLIETLRHFLRRNANDFYVGGILIMSVLLIALVMAPLIPTHALNLVFALAFALLLLPATQGAVDLFNNLVTAIFRAEGLPKLDFSKGVPAGCETLVAVPTLLLKEKQVRELFDDLEVRYLANRDPNIHFALITDLPDSVSRPREHDTDALVDLAVELTDALNHRYAKEGAGSFLLLHRHRVYNTRQGVWMGWERKRGKLLDLNKLMLGEYDPFPVKAGPVELIQRIRYVITLDSDTELPRGVAHRMIGALAHPLNRAIIDPDLRIVTRGYGILQPRVGVSVSSAARSRLAAIYSGQTGFDIYARAISDVYQDLYGEGIFTGKGIYEVAALHAVLDRRFPRNSLLSHDLIEGAYARAGLATDIEVIDDYPSHYSAHTRRKHRWVRGDWQIAQWLFARVPNEAGTWVRNPIALISQWKIFDNLRRSLVEPFTFLLLVVGWLVLPGGALYWTLITLALLTFPAVLGLLFSLIREIASGKPTGLSEVWSGFTASLAVVFLTLIYLPHQTMLSIDAIVRALVRRFITGQRLLEWETAAEAEANTTRVTPVDRYLAVMPLVATGLAILVGAVHYAAIPSAAVILLLWGFSPFFTQWLNRPAREANVRLRREDETFLRNAALRTWRFYAEFGGESNHWLIPDNVEEAGLHQAVRLSPTNLGMLLNARQAAVEFGYLTTIEFAELTQHTLETYARLEKHRGHIYNWYDIPSLSAIPPLTVSTVDSGNLAASFYTLQSGCHDLLRRPILSSVLTDGILDLLQMTGRDSALPPPAKNVGLESHIEWLFALAATLSPAAPTDLDWWKSELRLRVHQSASFVRSCVPWLMPEFAPLRSLRELPFAAEALSLKLAEAPVFARDLERHLSAAWAMLAGDPGKQVLCEQLRALMPAAVKSLTQLTEGLSRIAEESAQAAAAMDFQFLLNPTRHLLSIGYDTPSDEIHGACYDLLASEARMATFIAIAKGDIPQDSWFKLGRTHTSIDGRLILLSWTGTMFEYQMPQLWMRNHPDTLMSRSLVGAVHTQRNYVRPLNIPWGISESGHATLGPDGHYQYHAFGIPALALKYEALDGPRDNEGRGGPVISPYSTFLALGVDTGEALRNLRRMAKLGWIADYGFYEAADYSSSTRNPRLVKSWMAHHQGMSLLAVTNLLFDNLIQRWFHADPHLKATELLLHEKPIRVSLPDADAKRSRVQIKAA